MSSLGAGCGYTAKTLLPENVNTVFINNFSNKIDTTKEASNSNIFRTYRPGLENDITREIKNRFIFDGTLRVVNDPENADLVLEGDLIDFIKEPLRYDSEQDVKEFRLKLVVNISVEDVANEETLWKQSSMVGESTYRTEGEFAESESDAIREAINDMSKRIIEKTTEIW
jgi:hypothetical protein